jgi:hypothetical protein
MAHDGATGQFQILPDRSAMNQIGMPDENIAFLGVEIKWSDSTLLDEFSDARLIFCVIRSVTVLFEILFSDSDIRAEQVRQTVASRVNNPAGRNRGECLQK